MEPVKVPAVVMMVMVVEAEVVAVQYVAMAQERAQKIVMTAQPITAHAHSPALQPVATNAAADQIQLAYSHIAFLLLAHKFGKFSIAVMVVVVHRLLAVLRPPALIALIVVPREATNPGAR